MKKVSITVISIMIGLVFPLCIFAQSNITTFRLWSWLPSYEKQYFNLAASEFNKQNPQTPVKLTYKYIPFEDLHAKLIENTGRDEDLPDILAIEFRQWPTYEADNPEKYLIDLTNVYNQHASQLFNNIRYEYVYHKKHFALGWQAAPLVLVYQKNALDKAGLSYPFKTWNDFKTAAVKAHRQGKTLALMEVKDPQIFYSIFLQKGGKVYDSNGNFVFPQYVSQAKDVFHLLKYLHDKAGFGRRTVNNFISGSYTKQFTQHHIMGLVAGDWILMIIKQEFPAEKGQWRIQPSPVWTSGGYQGTSIGGTGYALVKKQSRSPQKLALLKKFLSFATISFHMQALYFKKSNLQMTNKMLFSRVYAITFSDPYLGSEKTLLELRGELKNLAPRYVYPGLNIFLERLTKIQSEYIDGTVSLDKVIRDLSQKPG